LANNGSSNGRQPGAREVQVEPARLAAEGPGVADVAARAAQVASELPRRRELEGEVVRRVAEGPGEPGA